MSIYKKFSMFVLVGVLVVSGFIFINSVKAAPLVGGTAAADITSGPFGGEGLNLNQSSDPKVAISVTFGIDEAGKTLNSIEVSMTGTSGTPTWTNGGASSSELLDLAATGGGISLWKEATVGPESSFSSSTDTEITLASSPVYGGSNNFVITPATPPTISIGDVYYVVLKSKASGVTNGNAFTMTIGANGVTTSATPPTITPVTTQNITMDTVAPTLSSGQSFPSNGSTGIPVETFMNMQFSENLDFSTINPSNISMTTGGNPVGTSIKSMPNGFNLIVSNPPTYTVGSRFVKMPGTSFAFYNIFGTGNTIMPQGGSYTTPTTGDVVYFQHDAFPAEIGIVTNATLTSGTFAINGFTLNGGQAITKFSTTVAATGVASSSSTALQAGDLIVVNTSASPTSDRYGWHIVTTGAAVNDSGLRLDGATSAPTYVSGSYFSKIMGQDAAPVGGSNQISGLANPIRFTTGDMIFAKVTANADNLGTYAWHTVTADEDVSTDTAPTTLRLDSNATAPTFAANSEIFQALPLSLGQYDLITNTTTTFNFGDIIFAKTTAGSATNGSYAFHLVSNGNMGVGGAGSSELRFDNYSAPLSPSTLYTITMGTGIKDKAGNPLASTQTVSFTTGSTTNTNTTPPFITASTPQDGAQTFPSTGAISVQFSVPMDTTTGGSVLSSSNISLSTDNYGAPGTPVTATNTYNSGTNTVTITPQSALTTGARYILKINQTTKSNTGVSLPQPFFMHFMTAGTTDTTRPTVTGVFPQTASTGVSKSLGAISIGFSEDLDPGTVCVTTCVTLSGGITGTTSYNSQNRTISFTPSSLLASGTTYTVTVSTDVKDLAGNALLTPYTSTFTTGSSTDSTAPTIAFANADNFGVAVTFSEPMKSSGGPSAVDNISNYTLESPIGSSIALGGKTVTYDGPSTTAKISGLSLQNGNTFKVTVSNFAQDLSSNAIATTGSPAGNIGVGTVFDSNDTGGNLGPDNGQMDDFSMQGISPTRVSPMNRSAGATSNYSVELPVTQAIPLGGSIVLTFPLGFDVTNVSAATAGSESFRNSDLNGPAAGTPTIASAVGNSQARTVTITTGGATTGSNTFIAFDLKGIVNSTVPSSTGYSVNIKTRDTAANSNALLETKTSGIFFLGTAGTRTLTVNVFKDLNTNGSSDSGEEIQNVKVFLFNPAQGGREDTTNSSGQVVFSSLENGDYEVGLNPASLINSNISFNSAPQHILISGNTVKNFALSATTLSISGTVTGPASTSVDVFAGSPNGFTKKTLVLTGGNDAYSLPISSNTTYMLGVGPAIPEGNFMPGSLPPPPPVFTFMPPPNIQVSVQNANITGKNFTLSTANRTLTGTVKDNATNGLNGVQVFARPVAASTTGGTGSAIGFGSGAITDSSGNFTLKLVDGIYVVEAFKPGFPAFSQKQVTITSLGNTPSVINFVANTGTTLTISGTIKDATGNAVPFAGISGRKVISTSDTTPIGGGGQNFVNGQSDANGSYTLYVEAGTWVVESFAPGLGKLGSKTLSVSTTSLSGQDFSAETLQLGTISGTASKDAVNQQGVMVRADGSSGSNMAVTDASGAYSLKVPAGTYTIKCFFPGVGDSAPITSVVVTADTTTSGKNCTLAAPITITVNLTDGTNPITNAFVDVRDSNGRGNGTSIYTTSGANAIYTVIVPPGTYTVRANHPAYGQAGTTTGVNTTRSITYTTSVAVGSLQSVTGTITGDGSPLSGAWVSLRGNPTDQTRVVMMGGQTASNGTFSISVPNGIYSIRADKPGYKTPAETSVTVNGTTVSAGTIALTTASRTITGTISLNSSGVSNAFVDATDGNGGFAVSQTDSTGAYSLPVDNGTWAVRAHGSGYDGGPLSVVVNGNSPSSQNITLTAIAGFTITPPKGETMVPTAGGFFTNSDIGADFKVNIPANALGTSSNANTVTTKANTALPTPPSGSSVLAKNGVTISAVDSAGAPVTSLNDTVTIVVPYDDTALPVGADEGSLVLATWNTATNQYDTLPTTVDETANTLTAQTSHFSDFVPLVPTVDSSPSPSPETTVTGSGVYTVPIAPTMTSATVKNTDSIVLEWNETYSTSGYKIFRNSSDNETYVQIGENPTISSSEITTYEDTGLSQDITYNYKVIAFNEFGDSEESNVSSINMSGVPTIVINPPVPISPSITITPAEVITTSPRRTYNLGSTILKNGSRGEAVKELQRFLNDTMNLGLDIDGILGPKTIAVMKQWQKDKGLQVDGLIGPNTKSMINSSAVINSNNTAELSPSLTYNLGDKILKNGSRGEAVKELQRFLNDTMNLGLDIDGILGPKTIAVMKQWQKDKGLQVDGLIGPKTKAKINSITQ